MVPSIQYLIRHFAVTVMSNAVALSLEINLTLIKYNLLCSVLCNSQLVNPDSEIILDSTGCLVLTISVSYKHYRNITLVQRLCSNNKIMQIVIIKYMHVLYGSLYKGGLACRSIHTGCDVIVHIFIAFGHVVHTHRAMSFLWCNYVHWCIQNGSVFISNENHGSRFSEAPRTFQHKNSQPRCVVKIILAKSE